MVRNMTRHETEDEHPNYFVRKVGELERQPLTEFMDPAKSLREVRRNLSPTNALMA